MKGPRQSQLPPTQKVQTKKFNRPSTARKVSFDHARRVIGQIKQIVQYAHLYEYLEKDTIQAYKLKRSQPKELIYLTEQELNRLMHYSIATPIIRLSADLFKFQCWTGLSYADLASFSINNIERDNDRKWITYRRKKLPLSRTASQLTEAILPLFPEAEAISSPQVIGLPFVSPGTNDEEVAIERHTRSPPTTSSALLTASNSPSGEM